VGAPLDWSTASEWTFEPLDNDAFPSVALAKRVGSAGSTYPAVFNAANEQAVRAFHEGRLPFLGIVDTVAAIVDAHSPQGTLSLESLADAEEWARREADRLIAI
jgi:1-deoxy-D-xylulose-5-phosphate reductoisomerase